MEPDAPGLCSPGVYTKVATDQTLNHTHYDGRCWGKTGRGKGKGRTLRQDGHGRPLGEGDIQVETSMRRSPPVSVWGQGIPGSGDSQFKSHEKEISLSSGQR